MPTHKDPMAGLLIPYPFSRLSRVWKRTKNTEEPKRVLPSNLLFTPVLKQGEKCISATEALRRAESMGANLGQPQAEFLLGHQNAIPIEQQKNTLVFAGTLWEDRKGTQYVPCLRFELGRSIYARYRVARWNLYLLLVNGSWDDHYRLVRLSPTQSSEGPA